MVKRALIPNVITMGNLVIGFFAILFASTGDPKDIAIAGILVFVASFCDGLDGAAARGLGVTSEIGAELDSFADAVSYGIAPAFISYQAFFKGMPELGLGLGLNWGMLLAVTFPVFAVLRLARFNIEEGQGGFTGLPSPAAGILVASVASFPLSSLPFFEIIPATIPSELIPLKVFIPFYLVAGLLMVSTIDYTKLFSDLYGKGKIVAVITALVVIALLVFFRMWAPFGVTLIYILVGMVNYVIKKIKGSPEKA
ncbi:MAG: hypothetical protein GY754_42210 [bacterium]|nr:hypothetical protein [bacterium]